MRVFITGGSGFVGCHIIAALVEAGHEVVAFVRNEEKLSRALAPFGRPSVRVQLGTIDDAAAIKRGLDGCDACIHVAAVFSLDPRRKEEMAAANVDGAKTVLSLALDAGCDPVVHVSSIVTLLPLPKMKPPAEASLGVPLGPYSSSKHAAEMYARGLQEDGAPLVTTYPGNVFGPHDPGPGEMRDLFHGFLGNRFPFIMWGAGLSIVDVRWLARAHVALLEKGQGPRRVAMGGTYVSWDEMFAHLRELTGRALPQFIPSPRFSTLAVGWTADALRTITGIDLPFSREQNQLVYASGTTNQDVAVALAGMPPSTDATIRDAIVWLVDAGHLPRSFGGALTRGQLPVSVSPH